MYKDDRIEVSVCLEQDDYVRQMEIYAGEDGAINPWRSVIIEALIALALIAGAAVSLLMGWGESLITCGVFALVYVPWVIASAVHVPKVRKIRQAQYEEAKSAVDSSDKQPEDRSVGSVCFGRYNLFLRSPIWDEAVPYRAFSRCVEYSDGLYFEREFDDGTVQIFFVPAGYLSAQTTAEIISRLKEAKARYTCISELRPAEHPQVEKPDEDLFDLSKHKLLCEVEYTVTPEEIEKASAAKICFTAVRRRLKSVAWAFWLLTAVCVGFPILLLASGDADVEAYMLAGFFVGMIVLLFWFVWHSNITAVSKLQKKLLQDEAKYGSRVALYEDLICVRTHGDDTLYLYNWLSEVFRTPDFVCIRNLETVGSSKEATGYFAIPVRALDDADGFVSILEDRMQAAFDGAITIASAPADNDEKPADSRPLRKAKDHGRKILSARYKGVDVCIRRRFRVTELVIDGFVYAERKELIESAYDMAAVVDGVVFAAQQREDGQVQIFANGFEIASGTHRI